jgi:hypothetical protein
MKLQLLMELVGAEISADICKQLGGEYKPTTKK